MIPKIIHYCWFGGKEKPEQAKKCIESWKKFCPDYEIKEWNESNFDLNFNDYTKEAFKNKKWAFITDVVRLYAMWSQGGVYMDTDVELLKGLDEFLCYKAFSGFESCGDVPTGLMASEKGLSIVKELLDDYVGAHFEREDGSLDTTTNVVRITNVFMKHGLKRDGARQTICDFELFPSDYFCPKSVESGEINLTDNSVCIHHFGGSWLTKGERKRMEYQWKYFQKYGIKRGSFVHKIRFFPFYVKRKLKKIFKKN